MADIVNFRSKEDWEAYQLIFEEHLHVYMTLANRIREEMYGTGNGNWSNLPGTCAERVLDVLNTISYAVGHQFKEKYPEYKTDDDELFIPRRSFKEDVEQALLAANQKFWNSGNNCEPCEPCDTFSPE